jgi:hypothetical protein
LLNLIHGAVLKGKVNLKDVIGRFSQAIIATSGAGLISLCDFPMGSCGDASDLLGEYLREHDYGDWIYMHGQKGDQTHAWIEQDDVIIDITVRQFGTDMPMVTNNHEWYQQFEPEPEGRLASIATSGATPDYVLKLQDAYSRIATVIDTS